MASGIEMMMQTMLKNMVSNLPPELKAQIDMFGQTVLAFKQQQDRIEAKLDAVLALHQPGGAPVAALTDERETHGEIRPEHGQSGNAR